MVVLSALIYWVNLISTKIPDALKKKNDKTDTKSHPYGFTRELE